MSPTTPTDAEPAPRELMTLPGQHYSVRRWHLAEIHLEGQWRPAMLSEWRRPPGSPRWVAHLRWGPDASGTQAWGWFLHSDQAIRPLAEPADGGTPDAAVVPTEQAGAPDPDDAGRCWRLAWIRTGGAWRSAIVFEQRRPGPGPWIAHARWGEDREAAWVVADGVSLRPVQQHAVTGGRSR
ncbi:hypothetical protein ACFXDE_01845 [Kitasatospora sp. NPDC059408]|uniref:hypothetical protein n=1 Tax=Kitasatospora sp. NPDC059408 TaxID=3346823 RepID=UPI0036943BE9